MRGEALGDGRDEGREKKRAGGGTRRERKREWDIRRREHGEGTTKDNRKKVKT